MEKKADFHSLSRKAKVQYVWDYYKWPIAAAIAALCFVIYLIYHYATYRDPLLNVIMMNCNDSITADSKGFDDFSKPAATTRRKIPSPSHRPYSSRTASIPRPTTTRRC